MPSTLPSIEQLLDEQRDAFDVLCGEVSGGIRGPSHFDELESRADAIARSVRAAFREGNRR